MHKKLSFVWRSSSSKSYLSNLRKKPTLVRGWISTNKTFVPSMIRSARHTVLPVAITNLAWKLFREILKSGNGRTERRTDVQTTRAKIVITTGRDCGSVFMVYISIFMVRKHALLVNVQSVLLIHELEAPPGLEDWQVSGIHKMQEVFIILLGQRSLDLKWKN